MKTNANFYYENKLRYIIHVELFKIITLRKNLKIKLYFFMFHIMDIPDVLYYGVIY